MVTGVQVHHLAVLGPQVLQDKDQLVQLVSAVRVQLDQSVVLVQLEILVLLVLQVFKDQLVT
jgi:hypothetical protein